MLNVESEWLGVIHLNEELLEFRQQNMMMEIVKLSNGEVRSGCKSKTVFSQLEVLDHTNLSEWHKFVNIILLRHCTGHSCGRQGSVGIRRVNVREMPRTRLHAMSA